MRNSVYLLLVVSLALASWLIFRSASRSEATSIEYEPLSRKSEREVATVSTLAAGSVERADPRAVASVETTDGARSAAQASRETTNADSENASESDWLDTFWVQVIGSDGEPAPGVIVSLLADVSGSREYEAASVESAAPTGVAAFGPRRVYRFSQAPELRLTSDVAGLNPSFVPLPYPVPEDTRVELRLPRTGSVLVRVLDAETSPMALLEKRAEVELFTRTPSGEEVAIGSRRTEGGVARFERVEVGLSVFAIVRCAGHDASRSQSEVTVFADREQKLDLPVGARVPTLSLRLIDPNGTPLSNAEVRLTTFLRDPKNRPSRNGLREEVRRTYQTDGEGRLSFEQPWLGEDESRVLEFRTPDTNSAVKSLVNVPLPVSPARGETRDLGEVRLASAPILAAGRVVDEQGFPIPGARVSVDDSPDYFDWPLTTLTDEDGLFEVTTSKLPESMILTGSGKGYEDRDVETFLPGSQDVVIRLAVDETRIPTGEVLVQTEMPERFPRSNFYLCLETESGTVQTRSILLPLVTEFRFTRLESGTCSVYLRSNTTGLVFGTVTGVPVVEGELTRDKRLLPLDFRPEMRTVGLRLGDLGGEDLNGTRVQISLDGMDRTFPMVVKRGGRLDFVVPQGLSSLKLELPDGRTERVAIADDGKRVEVEF